MQTDDIKINCDCIIGAAHIKAGQPLTDVLRAIELHANISTPIEFDKPSVGEFFASVRQRRERKGPTR